MNSDRIGDALVLLVAIAVLLWLGIDAYDYYRGFW
jgi:hypothetical protein